MKKALLVLLASAAIIASCKSGKGSEKKEQFFPVLSFLKSQVADIDTSLYMIRRIDIIDSAHADTSFVKREEVRGLAADFLNMPDLYESKYQDDYTETKLEDESLRRVIFSYNPNKPEKQDIQLQEVVVTPQTATGDKVRSIIVNRAMVNKDSTIERRMLWQVGESFQITSILQKAGQPEVTKTVKVVWNEPEQ